MLSDDEAHDDSASSAEKKCAFDINEEARLLSEQMSLRLNLIKVSQNELFAEMEKTSKGMLNYFKSNQ